MSISMKNIERSVNAALGLPTFKKETPKVEIPEWIWVEGYKGTDKDMKCRDYQYELGKQFDMPEDAEIDLCSSGFHFCQKLKDVFKYYDVKNGNRFFKVTALIRTGEIKKLDTPLNIWSVGSWSIDSKETSKSIVFTRELTTDEILEAKEDCSLGDFTEEEKVLIREVGIDDIYNIRKIADLEAIGYAHEVADIIVRRYTFDTYDLAMALSKQTDISMDARVIAVFSAHGERKKYVDEFVTKNFTFPITNPYIQPLSATKTRGRKN